MEGLSKQQINVSPANSTNQTKQNLKEKAFTWELLQLYKTGTKKTSLDMSTFM